jgi:hypothetical protein
MDVTIHYLLTGGARARSLLNMKTNAMGAGMPSTYTGGAAS